MLRMRSNAPRVMIVFQLQRDRHVRGVKMERARVSIPRARYLLRRRVGPGSREADKVITKSKIKLSWLEQHHKLNNHTTKLCFQKSKVQVRTRANDFEISGFKR